VKAAIAVVVGTVILVSLVIFGLSQVADVSPLDQEDTATERRRTQEWDEEASAAVGGNDLAEAVREMVDGAREWQAGERPTEQFTAELDRYEGQFTDMLSRLDGLRDFPYDERVNNFYSDAAELYLQTVYLYEVLVQVPPGDVRTQVDLSARRTRLLADRVFDRGRAFLEKTLHEDPNPDVDMRLPEEVPNWVEEGIAAGPPLDGPPPAASTEPQLRQRTRPQQPRNDWLNTIKDLQLVPKKRLSRAVEEGDQSVLRNAGRDLVARAEELRRVPDPQGDREEGARVRLSLLLDAEAARAAHLAVQPEAAPGAARLRGVARKLLVVGQHLWEGPGLPDRSL
jgi:hypothetical protein